jgi:hypothetical protein
MESSRENYNFQKLIAVVGVSLFIVKIVAWYLKNRFGFGQKSILPMTINTGLIKLKNEV